ncbi:MAG TPA: CotH kinase family protein [Vicinamibacteria bacterium]|nr:CotH kinase family protein [Vicinamibacteria bacterium]
MKRWPLGLLILGSGGLSWWMEVDPNTTRSVVINEILLINRSTTLDEDGNRSAWIELLNAGGDEVDLGGFALSDDATLPRKWPLPRAVLRPGDRVLVHASGKNRGMHANFDLRPRSQLVVLTGPDEETSDAVALPRQTDDRSYGRDPDGTGRFHYFLTPTPGSTNRGLSSSTPISSRPRMNPDGGFYDQRLDVDLSMELPTDDFEIRYTTDWSPPGPESVLYAGPVTLVPDEGSKVVRAAAFRNRDRVSGVETHSYFFHRPSHGLPAVALTMDPSHFRQVHMRARERGILSERTAVVEVFEADGSRAHSSTAGLRLHGNTGRFGPWETKKSYRLHFRDQYGKGRLAYPLIPGHPDLERVVLRAGNDDAFRKQRRATYVRDQLLRQLHEDMGHVASHGAWYELYVNRKYHGVYNVAERIDRDFFSTHAGGLEWDIWRDGALDEATARSWDELLESVARRDLTDDRAYERASEMIDIESFTDYMILNIWAQNNDWPHKNYVAARPRGGKWIFLIWDAEMALGLHTESSDLDTFERAVTRGEVGISELLESLLRNVRYQELFLDRFEEHLRGTLSPDHVLERIATLRATLAAGVSAEVREGFSEAHTALWARNMSDLERFARSRPRAISEHVYRSPRLTVPRVIEVEPARLVLDGPKEIHLSGAGLTESTTVLVGDTPVSVIRRDLPGSITVTLPPDSRLAGRPTITVSDPSRGRTRRHDLVEIVLRSEETS